MLIAASNDGSWIPKLWPRKKSPNPPMVIQPIVMCTILLISFCELLAKSPFMWGLGCFFHALGLLFPISLVILSKRGELCRQAADLAPCRTAVPMQSLPVSPPEANEFLSRRNSKLKQGVIWASRYVYNVIYIYICTYIGILYIYIYIIYIYYINTYVYEKIYLMG